MCCNKLTHNFLKHFAKKVFFLHIVSKYIAIYLQERLSAKTFAIFLLWSVFLAKNRCEYFIFKTTVKYIIASTCLIRNKRNSESNLFFKKNFSSEWNYFNVIFLCIRTYFWNLFHFFRISHTLEFWLSCLMQDTKDEKKLKFELFLSYKRENPEH